MLVKVNKNIVEIDNSIVNKKEYNVTKLLFEFSNEYDNNLVKNALFTIEDETYEVPIINNECSIPSEVLIEKGYITFGVYAYEIEEENLLLRYSPSPTIMIINDGSFIENTIKPEMISPTQYDIYQSALNKGLNDIKDAIKSTKEQMVDIQDSIDEILINSNNKIAELDATNSKVIEIGNDVENKGNIAQEQGELAKEKAILADDKINELTDKSIIWDSSEQLRIENESSRVFNEAIRNSSEQARLTNELERAANELVREEYINQLKQDVEDGKFDGECNFATFNINIATGNLEMNKTEDLLLDFKIENGNLEVLI